MLIAYRTGILAANGGLSIPESFMAISGCSDGVARKRRQHGAALAVSEQRRLPGTQACKARVALDSENDVAR